MAQVDRELQARKEMEERARRQRVTALPPAIAAAASDAEPSAWLQSNPIKGVPRAAIVAPQATAVAAAPPPRVTSSEEDDDTETLATAAWYHASMPREDAIELLTASGEGAFVVRDSQTQQGNFALSLTARGQIHHFIIRCVPEGFILGNPDLRQPTFPDLASLIKSYCNERGCLPSRLSLATVNNLFEDGKASDPKSGTAAAAAAKTASAAAATAPGADSFVDPDYQSLKDLRSLIGRA